MKRLTTGELAKRCGINLETIRYYERRGILPPPPRTASGYRVYPDAALDRLRFIIQVQELGFSLDEVKEFMDLLIDRKSITGDLQMRAEVKIAAVNEKMVLLRRLKKNLVQLINHSCASDGTICGCPGIDAVIFTPADKSSYAGITIFP